MASFEVCFLLIVSSFATVNGSIRICDFLSMVGEVDPITRTSLVGLSVGKPVPFLCHELF